MLGVKVTYYDIEAIDPDYYKNLKWMLEVSYFNSIPFYFPQFTHFMNNDGSYFFPISE